MNKSQLVDELVAKTTLGRRDVDRVINEFIALVQQTVKKGDKVSLPGFGGWSQTQRKARVARNPRTGAAVKVPAGKGVKFTVGATFKNTVAAKRGTAAAKAAPAKATKAPAKAAPAKASAKAPAKAAPARAATKAPAKAAPAKASPAKAAKAPAKAPAKKAAKATKR